MEEEEKVSVGRKVLKASIGKRLLVKLTSFKNIVCIWSCVMFSWMVITKQVEFKECGYGLLFIIAGCIGVNLLQKKIEK